MKNKKKSKWYGIWDKSMARYYIRREVITAEGRKKLERYPNNKYKDICTSKEKIDEFLKRVNHRILREEEAKKNWSIKTAFLKTKSFNIDFYNWVFKRTDNKRYSRETVSYVRMHIIEYFEAQGIVDYLQWQSISSQNKLVESFIKKQLSLETMKSIKIALNLFFQFLNEESLGKIDKFKFSFPLLLTERVRKYERKRKETFKHKDKRLSGEDYISDEQIQTILAACSKEYKNIPQAQQPINIHSLIWLSYKYGLRRSECLALSTGNLRNSCLYIEKQVKDTKSLKELKWGKKFRKIPHFYTEGNLDEVHSHIQDIPQLHPDTVTKSWSALMKILNLRFTFHNLRNSFCSNLFRDMQKLEISHSDIQLAMGHSDLRTTMKYLKDFRKFEESIYIPSKKVS